MTLLESGKKQKSVLSPKLAISWESQYNKQNYLPELNNKLRNSNRLKKLPMLLTELKANFSPT
jgi:hypothetical protein